MGGGMIMQNLRNFLRLQWVRIRVRLFVTRVLLVTGVLFITEEMSPVLKQSANAAAPTQGLVGYWKFDESTGTTAIDSSGLGNNGTLTNGPTWTAGKVNGALSFDGTNDYVELPNEASFNFTNNFAVSVWMKTPGFAKPWASLVSKGDSAWSLT